MRKLSEILKVSKQFHDLWSTRRQPRSMCGAGREAFRNDVITEKEYTYLQEMCEILVAEVSSMGKSQVFWGNEDCPAYLYNAIRQSFNICVYELENVIKLIYEAWVDKLEEQGK